MLMHHMFHVGVLAHCCIYKTVCQIPTHEVVFCTKTLK